MAWTYRHKGGRVLYTSLGHPEDSELPAFRRLAINAIFWVMDRPVPEEAAADAATRPARP